MGSLKDFFEFMEKAGPIVVNEKDVPKDVKIVKQTMEEFLADPTGLYLHLKPDARSEEQPSG